MSTWNQPLWGDQNQPGTVDNEPPFPELYIRDFLNDLGQLPNELTPLKFIIDNFIATAGQVNFNLSLLPSQKYSPVIYLNGAAQTPLVNYSINGLIIVFPALNAGDKVQARYTH